MKSPMPEIRMLSIEFELERQRDAERAVRRARWHAWMDRLEPLLFALALAVMVGVLGPSLDDDSSVAIAMMMLPR